MTNVVTGPDRAAADATLDAFHALPDHAGSDFAGFLGRLAERGVDVVGADDGRFRWSDSAAGWRAGAGSPAHRRASLAPTSAAAAYCGVFIIGSLR